MIQITKLSDTLFAREYDVFISNNNIINFKSTSSFYLHIARNEFHLLLFQSMLRVEMFTERFLRPAACSSLITLIAVWQGLFQRPLLVLGEQVKGPFARRRERKRQVHYRKIHRLRLFCRQGFAVHPVRFVPYTDGLLVNIIHLLL